MGVDEPRRRQGVGRAFEEDLLRRATEVGCRRVQLLSHEDRRDEAHRFSSSLGFAAEAEGFRIALGPARGCATRRIRARVV